MNKVKVLFSAGSALSSHFDGQVFDISYDLMAKCDFSICDSEYNIENIKEACANSGTKLQDLDLLDKKKLTSAFSKVGAPVLVLHELTSLTDLNILGNRPFILKPKLGMNSTSSNPLGYKIFSSVEELSSAIETLAPNFWDLQLDPSLALCFQESVVYPNEQALLALTNVYVNGNGTPVFTRFYENWQKEGKPVETLDTEISDTDVEILKQRITAVIEDRGIKNCFFMIQFIRRIGGEWYPIDFSYRLDYQQMYVAPEVNLENCQNLVKYTYDLVPTVVADSTFYSHLRMISVNTSSHRLGEVFKEMGMISLQYTPLESHMHYGPKMSNHIFLTSGLSKKLAKEKMDKFEKRANAL